MVRAEPPDKGRMLTVHPAANGYMMATLGMLKEERNRPPYLIMTTAHDKCSL